jgi:hypothetical protein
MAPPERDDVMLTGQLSANFENLVPLQKLLKMRV